MFIEGFEKWGLFQHLEDHFVFKEVGKNGLVMGVVDWEKVGLVATVGISGFDYFEGFEVLD